MRNELMTTCDDLNRWLDEGAPASGEASARAHAAGCSRCARAIEAHATLERALASPPSTPSGAAFTARVMERVRAEGAPAPAERPAPRLVPWWMTLLSEPAFAAAAAATFVMAVTPAALRLEMGQSFALPATIAWQSIGAELQHAMGTWFGSWSGGSGLSPLARGYLLAGSMLAFLGAALWGVGVVAGAFRNPTRPRR